MVANDNFFSILGHLAQRRHGEDQLSNTFRACFLNSKAFRAAVLQCLQRACGIPRKVTGAGEWSCKTQVTKVFGRKTPESFRHDIVIESLDSHRGQASWPNRFILESKVKARLSKPQLKRYKRRTNGQLVAITKQYPEVPTGWLRAKNIASLRWQDIHRALCSTRCDTAIDKFLIMQFLRYLEVSHMAFREIRLRELNHFADLLGAIRTQKRDGIVPNIGTFTTADNCMSMLSDLEQELRNYLPDSEGWKTWGPGYYQKDYGEEGLWHSLCFTRYKGSRRKLQVDCSLDFPDDKDEDVYWGTYLTVNTKTRKHYRSIQKYCRKGLLEREQVLKDVISYLRRWKVAK